jgi:hypothetical protein
MGLKRFGAVVLCLSVGIACSSSSPGPSGGNGEGPDASKGTEGGTTDTSPDGSPSDARATSNDAAGDAGADATVELECTPPRLPRWDGSVPSAYPCSSQDDTDGDGYPDCVDGCPYDGTKTAPGFCGCGIPDVDTDGDGVPDCIDECPFDPNNTYNGQCGCIGQIGLQPAGTSCIDSACPQSGATCDGKGVCGDRSACSPCPGGRFVAGDGYEFWLCGMTLPGEQGPGCVEEDASSGAAVTRMAAQSACAAKGMALVQIETIEADDFLAQFLTAPAWIGANDLQTPGEWYWSSPTSDSGMLFWSGDVDGSQQNGALYDWAAMAPGSNSCATIGTNGQWRDTDCSETHGYICWFEPEF